MLLSDNCNFRLYRTLLIGSLTFLGPFLPYINLSQMSQSRILCGLNYDNLTRQHKINGKVNKRLT
jgi:hypothetical protein